MSSPHRSELVDRQREIRELRQLAAVSEPQMGLLYGRRRVGKTYLLQHAWDEETPVFYFLAGRVTSEQNRQDLLRQFAEWSGSEIHVDDYPNWRTTFRRLFEDARQRPMIVVLDEFQYLLGETDAKSREVTSQLNAIWDGEIEKEQLNLTLILCGSEVRTMEGLGAGGPLYGRISWRQRLEPFDYFDIATMISNRPLREKAYLYGIFGGIPEYLDALRDDESFDEAVIRVFLSPRGEVHFQLEHLLEQEQGLRNPRKYRAVLSAVASGCTSTNEIKQRAFSGGTNHRVRRILTVLEDLGLVRRERNFRAGKKAPWRNRIADPAVRFWYRLVHPNRSRLEAGGAAEVWRHQIEPQLDTYMGKFFEEMLRQAFVRHHRSWGLAAASEWARWEGTARTGRSIEIDIAAELETGDLLTGEIKWSSSPVDVDLHFEHRADIQSLADSGHRWAHEVLEAQGSAGHLYVSAAGFTDAFKRRAKKTESMVLVDLEDLYGAR